MDIKNFTYLLILAATIAVPLALSFESKIQYFKKLKYLLPAIVLTGAVFIMWDISFTKARIWGFNPDYLIGINLLHLPVEEWAFFVVIPYSSVFIYEVLKFYWVKYEYANPFLVLSLALIVGFGLISYFFRYQGYTFLVSLFCAIYLGYTVFRNRFKAYITKFYFAYLVSLVPFLVVNGLLTSLPVVEYSNLHIMNTRFFSIPVEDFAYFFLMLLMVTTIYEYLKERKYY